MSTNVRFYLSYDIKITLKSDFRRKNVIILSLCKQRCYGHQDVSSKSVNHQWFIDFIEWSYFTPRRDVIMIKNSKTSTHCIQRIGQFTNYFNNYL